MSTTKRPRQIGKYVILLRSDVPSPLYNSEGCLIWQGYVDPNGYPRLGKLWAHRYFYEQLVGPIPEGYEVDHTCFVPLCVEPAHLEAVIPLVNISRARFVKRPSASEVERIREAANKGTPLKALAAQYSVDRSTVWRWVNG